MGRRAKRRKGPRIPGGARDPRLHLREMRDAFPGFKPRIGRDNTVVWEGRMQPNPCSPAYRVRVTYKEWDRPRVFVLEPALDPDAPHVYSDGSLCLYWPKEWRWSDDESIAETIVVWSALWLEYYEIWKATGEWLGPSSHDPYPEEENGD